MSLKEEIQKLQDSFRSQMPEEVMRTFSNATEKLIQSGIADKSLNKGDKVPLFSLPNSKGETILLENLLKEGRLVISFYRGAWCPYCNLELKALQEVLPAIKKLGANLVAISPNLPDKSIPVIEKHSLQFEVLSDIGNKVASKFGLVFTLPDELRPIYEKSGLDIPDHNGDNSFELPIPATYVVNSDRTIVKAFVDADYSKRLEPEEVISALRIIKT